MVILPVTDQTNVSGHVDPCRTGGFTGRFNNRGDVCSDQQNDRRLAHVVRRFVGLPRESCTQFVCGILHAKIIFKFLACDNFQLESGFADQLGGVKRCLSTMLSYLQEALLSKLLSII